MLMLLMVTVGCSSSDDAPWLPTTTTYTVTFDSQSADVAANPTSKTVTAPATTVGALPAEPTKTGYNFAGWFTAASGGGTQFIATTAVTGHITVYAYWTTNPVYTVTYDSQGGTAVGAQHVTAPATTVGTLPANPTRTGYTFGGWWTAVSGGGTQFTSSTTVASDITVYAKWTATGTAYTAAATFTYAAGSLTINWTSSNFPCKGPEVGTQVNPVTITTTTMTWIYDDLTWTRSPAGTANDPRGTWTTTENGNTNTYTLVITGSTAASGSLSVTANIITCAEAETYHRSGDYGVNLSYGDPAPAVTSVSLTGPGISGSLSLIYSASDADWSTYVSFGASPSALPYTYNFTITDGTSWVETATVSCYVEPLPTVTAPGATATSATPTFSWNAVTGAVAYSVKVKDASGTTTIWESDRTTSTSVVYSGPALTSGTTYSYNVYVRGTNTCPHGNSLTTAQFVAF